MAPGRDDKLGIDEGPDSLFRVFPGRRRQGRGGAGAAGGDPGHRPLGDARARDPGVLALPEDAGRRRQPAEHSRLPRPRGRRRSRLPSPGRGRLMHLTRESIDVPALVAEARPSDGAVCIFVGVVRNEGEGGETVAIEYEAYDEMAEMELAHVVASVSQEWPEARVRITHRIGRLEVGEPSVAVVATAPHRETAFTACRLAIEWVKEHAPIWKKE